MTHHAPQLLKTDRAYQYGAQNEVYNDDWVKSGLIVLCFS